MAEHPEFTELLHNAADALLVAIAEAARDQRHAPALRDLAEAYERVARPGEAKPSSPIAPKRIR